MSFEGVDGLKFRGPEKTSGVQAYALLCILLLTGFLCLESSDSLACRAYIPCRHRDEEFIQSATSSHLTTHLLSGGMD